MKFFYLAIIGSIFFLGGCGHNSLIFTRGKRLNVGINPQTQEAGFQLLDAEQVTVVEKDNALLTIELTSNLDDSGKKTTNISKIIYEIKEQTTGSDVALAEAQKEESKK